jgi:hypothetical protein
MVNDLYLPLQINHIALPLQINHIALPLQINHIANIPITISLSLIHNDYQKYKSKTDEKVYRSKLLE